MWIISCRATSPGPPGSTLLGPSTTDYYLDYLHYVLKRLNSCPCNFEAAVFAGTGTGVKSHLRSVTVDVIGKQEGKPANCYLLVLLNSGCRPCSLRVHTDMIELGSVMQGKKNRSTSGFPYPSPPSLFPASLAPSPSRSISHQSRLPFSL